MWSQEFYQYYIGSIKFFRIRLLNLEESDLEDFLNSYERQAKSIKEEIYTISWYMRGGVTSEQLMFQLSVEDREILNTIINKNIENTKTSRMPLL